MMLVVLECLKDCVFDSADCLRSFVIMPFVRSVVHKLFDVFSRGVDSSHATWMLTKVCRTRMHRKT